MLELKNITVDLEGRKGILNDVSLTIEDSKFIVITGPNGGGKSTLAKVIAGIVQPVSGQIILNGRDITSLGITERGRAGIAFAFQQPIRFKGITVRELIRVAAADDALSDQQICGYLYDVGLCAKNYMDREINASLSGGEIKRIEIVTAIARGAQLTIFDEPEAGIDIWSFHHLTGVFENMRKTSKGSILLISHQERIFDIADEIVVIADGKIRMQGEKAAILPYLLDKENRCCFCAGGIEP